MRVGLVLGGGGAVGLAYHAAALAALEHELEWDPCDADVIVGTSAGAVIAALLRRGVSAADLAAVAVEGTPLTMPPGLADALRVAPTFEPVGLRRWLLRRPRFPSVGTLGRVITRPWTFDLTHALASVLPDGPIDITQGRARLVELFGRSWPEGELLLCTVGQRDLRRVVFGRDARPPVWQAVAASCAIPSYFRPIEIDGATYVDGGVRSPTNADVLARHDLDLVVIVSPMSAQHIGRVGYEAVMRRHAKGRLRREQRRLEDAGIPTLVIEPNDAVTRLTGLNLMNDEHVDVIVHEAYFDASDQLRSTRARSMLATLNTRTRRRRDLREPDTDSAVARP